MYDRATDNYTVAMTDSDEVHITEVIGTRGRYHALSALTFLMVSGIAAAEVFYMQFMAPKLVLYWNWDAESSNRTSFNSDNCNLDEIMNYNLTPHNSTETSRLVYESPYSTNSLTQKLDLVCERSWMVSFLKSLPWIGIVVGNILLGPIIEKQGRKRCTLFLLFIGTVCNVVLFFVENFVLFAIPFLIAAAIGYTAMPIIMALYADIVENSKRQYLGPLLQVGFTAGMCLVAGAAWISKDWIYTHLVLTVYYAFLIPLTWCLLESPSWLVLKGRDEEAKEVIKKMIKWNRHNKEDSDRKTDLWIHNLKQKQMSDEKLEKGKFSDLFKNKVIAKYTMCLIVAESLGLYCTQGIFINVEQFGSGLFEDFFISNAVSFLALPIVSMCVRKIPVKWTQIILFALLGFVCALYPFVYVYSAGRTVVTILGRSISGPVSGLNMAYTAEVFPTSVRVIGQAFVISFSRMFIALAPFSKEFGQRTAQYVPFILFSAMSFLSVIMFVMLPNTTNRPLVHTVQELENKSKNESKPSTKM